MILKVLKLNTPLGEKTNCYIMVDEKTKEAIVIDPASEADKILEMLNILDAKVKYIYITHCHGDHVGALKELKNCTGAKILTHRLESENLQNPDVTLNSYIGIEEVEIGADSRVDDNDLIHVGDIEFKVIHTPGHTSGSTSLYCEEHKLLFSGDTLFRGTWGRTDLPTGNKKDIISSITYKLVTLPDDVIVYPGHGKSTMVREEKPIYLELKPRID